LTVSAGGVWKTPEAESGHLDVSLC